MTQRAPWPACAAEHPPVVHESDISGGTHAESEVLEKNLPHLVTSLPGPKAKKIVELDAQFVSPSYTRGLSAGGEARAWRDDRRRGRQTFLDFAAGIAVVATGHCHPEVVAAIQKQAAELIHMSGTDFYYQSMVELAQKLGAIAPGKEREARLLRQFGHGSDRGGASSSRDITPGATKSSRSTAASTAARWARFRSRQARRCSAKDLARCWRRDPHTVSRTSIAARMEMSRHMRGGMPGLSRK